MKRILLAFAFVLGISSGAMAACTSPAVMHDFPGTAFNMSLATNAGDGNCASNVGIVGTLPAYAAIPAFKFDQTTPGTTNGVQVNAALPAGTNLMGKVGIDQTTPGTTNGVQVNSSALPSGASTSANQTSQITQETATAGALGTTTDAPCTLPASATACTDTAIQKAIANAVNAAIPAGTNVIGFISNDPCSQANKTHVPIATSSGNVQLVAGVSAKQIYICSIITVGATASVQNIIEGTGAACTTANELAVIGSTTAASGMSFAANGGFAYAGSLGSVARTATAANGICLLQSGTAAIAGNITFVQQ